MAVGFRRGWFAEGGRVAATEGSDVAEGHRRKSRVRQRANGLPRRAIHGGTEG
ncbi:hypothetical protein GCM10027360_79950 [Amycolatopsis echigonensis]